MVDLIEGLYGTCGRCGSPLLGAHTIIKGDPTKHHYCPECHHNTPPLPGSWCPVGGGWLATAADTLRDRTERRLSGNWVI